MKKLIFLLLFPILTFAQMRIETKKYSADGYYNVAIPMHKQVKGVVWFFCGSGEEANTLEEFNGQNGPYKNELPKLFKDTVEYPYVFIWQQLKKGKTDWTKDEINPMFSLIDLIAGNLPKHVTGLSLGGRAVYLCLRLASEYHGGPGYFYSAGAVCGSTIYNRVSDSLVYQGNLKMHIWHGALDETVKPGPDRALFKSLSSIKSIKNNIEYTEYPNDGHGIWSKVYTQEYFPWLQSIEPKSIDPTENMTKAVIQNGILYIETDKGNRYYMQLNKIK